MATINLSLAAGSVASPYYFDVKITKQLCSKTPNAPVFTPVFTLVSYVQVGTITSTAGAITGYQYEAVINVQGIAIYTPCNKCCAKSQTVNQQFVIPFFTSVVPDSVTISSGTPINTLITSGGCGSCCSNVFQCDVPLLLSVITT